MSNIQVIMHVIIRPYHKGNILSPYRICDIRFGFKLIIVLIHGLVKTKAPNPRNSNSKYISVPRWLRSWSRRSEVISDTRTWSSSSNSRLKNFILKSYGPNVQNNRNTCQANSYVVTFWPYDPEVSNKIRPVCPSVWLSMKTIIGNWNSFRTIIMMFV